MMVHSQITILDYICAIVQVKFKMQIARKLAYVLWVLLQKFCLCIISGKIINKDKDFSEKHERSKSCLNMIYLGRVRGFERMFDHK